MPEQPSVPSSSLSTRVVSAVVGGPLVLCLVLWPGGGWLFSGWPFALLVLLLVLVGLREFYDGCRKAGLTPRDEFGYAAGLAFVLLATPLAPDSGRGLEAALSALVGVSLVAEALRPGRS